MQTLRWSTIDKAAWGPGPWQDEPDKMQWPDPATALACLAHRHATNGHWCGYVGVPEGHALHGRDYSDVDVDVHGGLTFAAGCRKTDDPAVGICHVREPHDPEVWWFGFDCAQLGDVRPGTRSLLAQLGRPDLFDEEECYRDLAYVMAECRALAQQLQALA